MIKFDSVTNKVEKIQDNCLDMNYAYVVQVEQEMYAYKYEPSLVCYSNLTSGHIAKTEKAMPLTSRSFPIVSNFNNEFIFIGAGELSTQRLKSVDMYTIANNTWMSAPELINARDQSGSCTLNDYLYIFCGSKTHGDMNESVEVLNARKFING